MSSSFVLASLFFMLGFVVGGAANEWRRRRTRRRRTPTFAQYYPDDRPGERKSHSEATDVTTATKS